MKKGRYSRQEILSDLGPEGQALLASASVLLIGCGGLACAVLPYLVGAGVGRISIADGDEVSWSNLHRQPLFSEADIGAFKVEVAVKKLRELNSEVHLEAITAYVDAEMALSLFPRHDIIIDATDRLQMRYLISDACELVGRPFVHAAVHQWQIQVAVFHHEGGPSYRCLYPHSQREPKNCAEAGVMGTTVGLAGMIQANEVIKMIIRSPDVLSGRLMLMDLRTYSKELISFQKREIEPMTKALFLKNHDRTKEESPVELARIEEGEYILLDVREHGEKPILNLDFLQHIPLSTLAEQLNSLDGEQTIYVFCQSGLRSASARDLLMTHGFKKVRLLKEQASSLSNLSLIE